MWCRIRSRSETATLMQYIKRVRVKRHGGAKRGAHKIKKRYLYYYNIKHIVFNNMYKLKFLVDLGMYDQHFNGI